MARFEAVLSALKSAGLTPRYVHLPAPSRSPTAAGGLGESGAARSCDLRIRFAGARRRAPAVAGCQAGAHLESHGAGREGSGSRSADRLRRHPSRRAPMRIAVLAAGYADGIPHRLGNRGSVIAKGKLAPIVGAVSMDLTTIDITDCPDLRSGDAVTLLGAKGTCRSTRSRWRGWRGRFPTACCAGSARG